MITIESKDDVVDMAVTGGYPVNKRIFTFHWNAGSEDYAALLAHNLRKALRDKLALIKQTMYDLGRKHQKGKCRVMRLAEFSGNFETTEAR